MTLVWILHQKLQPDAAAIPRARFKEACRRLGWRIATRNLEKTVLPNGRPVWILPPGDVAVLYRSLQQEPSVVLDLVGASIKLRPDMPVSREADLMRLKYLVEYKSAYVKLDGSHLEAAPETVLDAIKAKLESPEKRIAGYLDARALPFLPFRLDEPNENLDLDTQEGQKRFLMRYGKARQRVDANHVEWSLDPNLFHGKDTLSVHGICLPTGCHWDVKSTRGSATLYTAAEKWSLKAGQYVNIYPDMHVRTAQRKGGKRIWASNK